MIRRSSFMILLPVLFFLVSAHPAFSDILPKGYLALKGGYFSPAGDFKGEKLTGAPYGELAGGVNWGILGAELGVGYLKTENSLVDIKTVPILFSGKLQIPAKDENKRCYSVVFRRSPL